MEVKFILNGKQTTADIKEDTVLLDLLRAKGCYSVKCGCETTNCGLCTVWIDGTPSLSCSVLAARVGGKEVTTLEGLRKKRQNSAHFWQQRGQSSVDTVRLDLL